MNMINVYNTYYVKLYERKVPILMIFYCVYKVTTLTGFFIRVCQQKPHVDISTFRQLLSSVLIDAYDIDKCNFQ